MAQSHQEKPKMVQAALTAIANVLNVPLPKCIQSADPEIFDGISIEIASFLVFYADRWEKGLVNNEAGKTMSALFDEWCDMTSSNFYKRYLYKVVSNIFMRQILHPKPKICIIKRYGHERPGMNGVWVQSLSERVCVV